MKRLALGFIIGLALGSFARAQEVIAGNSRQEMFVQGGNVRLMLASGEYRVRAGASDRVRVRWEPETPGDISDIKDAKKVKVRMDVAGTVATIKTGGPTKHVRFIIEMPARSDLFLRMRAGDVRIAGIEGNKDIHMTAGDLKIAILPEAYSHVHASVTFGDLKARPLGLSKDGIGNSMNWDGPGTYTLHASMLAGDLTLSPLN